MKTKLLTITMGGLFLAVLAVVPAYSAVPSERSETAAVFENAATYTVILKEVGPNKVKVVKILRSILGIELKDAYNIVNEVPKVIKENATAEEMENLKTELEAAGASVEVKEEE